MDFESLVFKSNIEKRQFSESNNIFLADRQAAKVRNLDKNTYKDHRSDSAEALLRERYKQLFPEMNNNSSRKAGNSDDILTTSTQYVNPTLPPLSDEAPPVTGNVLSDVMMLVADTHIESFPTEIDYLTVIKDTAAQAIRRSMRQLVQKYNCVHRLLNYE